MCVFCSCRALDRGSYMRAGFGAGTQEMQLFPCEQQCQRQPGCVNWGACGEMQLFPCEQQCQRQPECVNWGACGEMQQPPLECMWNGYSMGRPLYEGNYGVGWRGAGGPPNGWGAQYAGVHCREAGGPQHGSFLGV
jgi:hypothetical protein